MISSTPTRALGELAHRYLDALLAARRDEAARLCLEAVEGGGLSVRELYLEVFQPVLYEVGRLWEADEISVAHEHFVSAVTQALMARLAPRIFVGPRRGRSLVAACAGDELHEIGLRMVADFFEIEGWDTYYIGANAPAAAIAAMVRERGADLLALSATMPSHREYAAAAIAALRADPAVAATPVLVGGAAFAGGGWRELGADGYAVDAAAAVRLAERLVEGTPRGG